MTEQDEKLVQELIRRYMRDELNMDTAIREAITRTKETTRKQTLLDAAAKFNDSYLYGVSSDLRRMAEEIK